MANEKYTVGSTTYKHGAEVAIRETSNNWKQYRGCVGNVTGMAGHGNEYSGKHTYYFVVDLGSVSIQCHADDLAPLGLRRVVADTHRIVADGKR